MENQQRKIFANCSQTVRSHCEFRNVFANQFRIAKSDTPVHCSFAKFFSHKTYAKFRIAKFTMSSQSQFRNAKANFAMPKPISQCQSQFRNAKANFAMPKPISQCQIQFRNAKFKFAMPISISQCQYTVHLSQPMRNFALRNSQPTLRISQTHFALRNSLPLRNSHLQALSSSLINATDFQTW